MSNEIPPPPPEPPPPEPPPPIEIRLTAGDRAVLARSHHSPVVMMHLGPCGPLEADPLDLYLLSPAQAREVARTLERLADEIEPPAGGRS